MQNHITALNIKNQGAGLYNFTQDIKSWIQSTGIQNGLLTVFCRHTSASLIIQENADPNVPLDLQTFFKKLVPEGEDLYLHHQEGLDDMPGHIKSVLTDVSLSIPVMDGKAVLGTWQGVYLFEHRSGGQTREIILQILGD
ncbi:MAG: YjbQ family protein [Magnetovibrio sp.]|nr:YjbQ family protein [Magnetovibrio sp.]